MVSKSYPADDDFQTYVIQEVFAIFTHPLYGRPRVMGDEIWQRYDRLIARAEKHNVPLPVMRWLRRII